MDCLEVSATSPLMFRVFGSRCKYVPSSTGMSLLEARKFEMERLASSIPRRAERKDDKGDVDNGDKTSDVNVSKKEQTGERIEGESFPVTDTTRSVTRRLDSSILPSAVSVSSLMKMRKRVIDLQVCWN